MMFLRLTYCPNSQSQRTINYFAYCQIYWVCSKKVCVQVDILFFKNIKHTVHRLLWLVGDYDGVLFFVHEKFEEIGIKIASFPNDLSQTKLTIRLALSVLSNFLSVEQGSFLPWVKVTFDQEILTNLYLISRAVILISERWNFEMLCIFSRLVSLERPTVEAIIWNHLQFELKSQEKQIES